MGKTRHSKDRIFITATEWAVEYGGKKDRNGQIIRALPFDRCAISLNLYQTPVCLKEGVIFDLESLMEYLLKHKKNPISGEPTSIKDIIRLNMTKSDDGYWQCPIMNKALTNFSHVVAIKTTGNVYSYEAVYELNIKTKNYHDLITNEPFDKSDILTLQNPEDDAHIALRDINNFAHLKELREDNIEMQKAEGKVRLNPTAEKVMRAIEESKSKSSSDDKKTLQDYVSEMHADKSFKEDIQAILDMRPTIEDVNPGQINTDGKASSSFTSTVMSSHTSNATRLAADEEIREAICRRIRSSGKKGYVQLQTTVGNLNLELHCDIIPRTCWNFIALSTGGFYDNTIFHRLIPGFMVQGGDPSGTGSGGESLWKSPFRDEYDSRLTHDKRGILSMANSGPNTNGSQFFITFAPTPHLDMKHSVFGRLVGGAAVLDRIEAVGNDKKDRPIQEIKINHVEVLGNPVSESIESFKIYLKDNIDKRLKRSANFALPGSSKIEGGIASLPANRDTSLKRLRDESGSSQSSGKIKKIDDGAITVGKYMKTAPSKSTASDPKNDAKVAAFLMSQKSNVTSW